MCSSSVWRRWVPVAERMRMSSSRTPAASSSADEDGEIGVRGLPAAGDVGDDDADRVAGLHESPSKRRGVDRDGPGPSGCAPPCVRRRQLHPVGLQLRGDQLRGQRRRRTPSCPYFMGSAMRDSLLASAPGPGAGPLLLSSSLYAAAAEMSSGGCDKICPSDVQLQHHRAVVAAGAPRSRCRRFGSCPAAGRRRESSRSASRRCSSGRGSGSSTRSRRRSCPGWR